MSFRSIGFQTLLILNRLRNEQRIEAYSRNHEQDRRIDDQHEERDGGELSNKKRGDSEAPRVEPVRGR